MTGGQLDRVEASDAEIVALEQEVTAGEAQRASFGARAANSISKDGGPTVRWITWPGGGVCTLVGVGSLHGNSVAIGSDNKPVISEDHDTDDDLRRDATLHVRAT